MINKSEKYVKSGVEEGIRIHLFCPKCNSKNLFDFPKGTILTIFNNTSVLCGQCNEGIPRSIFLSLKRDIFEQSEGMLTDCELEEIKNPDNEKVWIDKEILAVINGTPHHKQRIINKILKETIKKSSFVDMYVNDLLEGDKNE